MNPLSWPAPAPSGARAWASSIDPPSDTIVLRLFESHLAEQDVQPGSTGHRHLEVVRKYGDTLHQLVDQDPALRLGGLRPGPIDVQIGQLLSHLLELAADVVGPCSLRPFGGRLGASSLDGQGEARFLLGKQIGSDLVVVVEAQQFPALGLKLVHSVREAASRPSAGPGGRRAGLLELPTNGHAESLVVADEPQPQHGSPEEPLVGPTRLRTALASVLAAVHPPSLAVLVEGHEAPAQTAADLARQEVRALAAALDPSPVGGGEVRLGDDRLVVAWEPLAVVEDLPEVDPRAQNAEDGGVVDAGGLGDPGVAGALGPQGENAADDRAISLGTSSPPTRS